jgi:Putative peptidoglycan binding domain
MINKSVLLCFILIWFSNYVFAQPESGMPSVPGKCYAKCLIPDQYVTEYQLLPKYTGPPVDTLTNTNIVVIHFAPKPSGIRWEKKRADKNCFSANPDDCLVWCKVNTPAINSIEYFVRDTILNPTFEWQLFPVPKLIKKGGFTEWIEVICDSEVTPKIIKKLQTALIEKGYYSGEVDGKISEDLNKALVAYQKQEGQAVGALSIESMKALRLIR